MTRLAAEAQRVRPSAETTDWRRVAFLVQVSRALDSLEETVLAPQKKVLYQFSARGHDLAQVLLGLRLTDRNDAVCGYYRSRPLLLALGVEIADALGSSMALSGGYSGGRDIGAVFNFPSATGASALPMCGGVGAQFTPTAGWAQAVEYHRTVLKDPAFASAIGVALGGDASVATNGFWSALTLATTLDLPMLFFIEDNGYGISVPGSFQTPGGDIAANLASFAGLEIFSGDGADPAQAASLIDAAVAHVRKARRPALLRLAVPRLEGHSFQDTQAYKSAATVEAEWVRDPLPRLRRHLVPAILAEGEWEKITRRAAAAVETGLREAEARPPADPAGIERFVFSEPAEAQAQGGLRGGPVAPLPTRPDPAPQGARINMVTAIRRTLEHELAVNPRVLVFGEDVGPKGGVHAVTLGLQERFGAERVFDTSLSEEGIIGRAVGMALAGLMPVPEIQFRKYANSAAEQINDCGTIRWRTRNRFAAPMVVRMPVGFFRCGDPWHSQTNEVQFVHAPGWRVAVPSNAEDAVGLLRTALRGDDPVMFFEHRAMLDAAWARRPYPGDDYALPFGRAKTVLPGEEITLVTWGAMVERCEAAARLSGRSAEVIDLRTLSPWDKPAVLASVRRTRRCLIVHEDLRSAGFGAEIAAVIAEEAFLDLDAPIGRLTMPDTPSPHATVLMEAVVPSVEAIGGRIVELVEILGVGAPDELVDIVAPAEQEGAKAVVHAWLKAVGERVGQDEPLLELETDKVAVEIASPVAGVLAEQLLAPEAEVGPGQVLGRIRLGAQGADRAPLPAPAAAPAASAASRIGRFDRRLGLSPSVRRLLAESGLDPAGIEATGRGGRLTAQDVAAEIARRGKRPAAGEGETRSVPHSSMRRQIAEHMTRSLATAPHVTAVFEADFTAVIRHRDAHRERFAREGANLTFMAYIVTACAEAMAAAPAVNSRWRDDALEIFADVNVGIGVALGDRGLIVPVIHRAGALSLIEIARRLGDLTERARYGKLRPAEVQGGTFSISNHGVTGSLVAAPIVIPQPQSAILGIGKLEKRVVAREVGGVDAIQIRPMAFVSLTIDHRALDGVQTNAWLTRFVEVLETWPAE